MNINIKRELRLPALLKSKRSYRETTIDPNFVLNVLFQCDAQQLIVTATDTEVEVNTTMSLGTQEPLKRLFQLENYLIFVKSFPKTLI